MTTKKILIGVGALVLTIFWVQVGLFIYRYVQEKKQVIAERQASILKKGTFIEMIQLEKAIEMFYSDCNRIPTTEEGLAVLVQAPSNCSNWGPDQYIKVIKNDKWEHPFIYEATSPETFVIRSLGPDGIPSEDDRDLFVEGSVRY